MNYSVLMSVYSGEKPKNLNDSLESIFAQSVITDDLVLVCDGPLTEELDSVVNEYTLLWPDIMNIVRMPKQRSWAAVLNRGLDECKNTWVARMDSDDISVPDRCEKQIKMLSDDKSIAVISTGIGEFSEKPNELYSCRILPQNHEDIVKFSKYRCPLNHATVIYNKLAVQSVGGYEDFSTYEDYQLWIKMIKAGFRLKNTPEILYLMRAGEGLYQRRGGLAYLKKMLKFKKWMHKQGVLSFFEYITTVLANGAVILMPNRIRGWIYRRFLRNKSSHGSQ